MIDSLEISDYIQLALVAVPLIILFAQGQWRKKDEKLKIRPYLLLKPIRNPKYKKNDISFIFEEDSMEFYDEIEEYISLKNIGLGTAINLTAKMTTIFKKEKLIANSFKFIALKINESINFHDISFKSLAYNCNENGTSSFKILVETYYEDLLQNKYIQNFEYDLVNPPRLISHKEIKSKLFHELNKNKILGRKE